MLSVFILVCYVMSEYGLLLLAYHHHGHPYPLTNGDQRVTILLLLDYHHHGHPYPLTNGDQRVTITCHRSPPAYRNMCVRSRSSQQLKPLGMSESQENAALPSSGITPADGVLVRPSWRPSHNLITQQLQHPHNLVEVTAYTHIIIHPCAIPVVCEEKAFHCPLGFLYRLRSLQLESRRWMLV